MWLAYRPVKCLKCCLLVCVISLRVYGNVVVVLNARKIVTGQASFLKWKVMITIYIYLYSPVIYFCYLNYIHEHF